MALDRQTVKAFRNDFQDAVKTLETKYGMTVSLGTIRFNGHELRGKMTAAKTLASKAFAKTCQVVTKISSLQLLMASDDYHPDNAQADMNKLTEDLDKFFDDSE